MNTALWTMMGLLLISPAGLPDSAERKQPPVLNLGVCDMSELDSKILNLARENVLRIFGDAGVRVQWTRLDAGSACETPAAEGLYVTVVIMQEAPRGWTSAEAVGVAPIRAGLRPRAYVFSSSLTKALQGFGVRSMASFATGVGVGHAIAHELGHILISHEGHSLVGIMQPNWHARQWSDAMAGKLLFLKNEIKDIHSALSK